MRRKRKEGMKVITAYARGTENGRWSVMFFPPMDDEHGWTTMMLRTLCESGTVVIFKPFGSEKYTHKWECVKGEIETTSMLWEPGERIVR